MPTKSRFYWTYASFLIRNPIERPDVLGKLYEQASRPEELPRSAPYRAAWLCWKERWAEALELINTLPAAQRAPVLKARALLGLRRDAEALALLQNPANFRFSDLERFGLLALALEKAGRFAEAEHAACYAAYVMPDDPDVQALAARLLARTPHSAALQAIVNDPVMAPLPPGKVP
ncbi:hypothetical protein DB346_19620 [Verrucomicrobia bacterium LW23]|nr:hypothetical protein DB346_19620 [Verrucomicrobia bacterium LW23]